MNIKFNKDFGDWFSCPTTERLKEIITTHVGESCEIEYKRDFVDDKISKEILGFSNSNGGCIIIGIDYVNGQCSPYGVEYMDESVIRNKLGVYISSDIQYDILDYNIDNKYYIVIFVHLSDNPHFTIQGTKNITAGVFYIRNGSITEPADSNQLNQYLMKFSNSNKKSNLLDNSSSNNITKIKDMIGLLTYIDRESCPDAYKNMIVLPFLGAKTDTFGHKTKMKVLYDAVYNEIISSIK